MMSHRIANHILFWLAFVSLYVIVRLLFIAPSDEVYSTSMNVVRYFLMEIAFLPWKIIPFYVLFYYLIPKYFFRGEYFKLILFFLIVLLVCLLGYRSVIKPVQFLMYGDTPAFNVYSLKRVFYSLTDLLPAIALGASAKLLKDSIVSRRNQKLLEAQKLEAELNFLKAQTNPHFLFNTLNNLYGLARKNDSNTAPSILKLSNIMRYILYECSQDKIPLKSEISIIEDFIQLEKLRYDDRLKVNFIKIIDDWSYEIAPLILLPFVENAFKHGASENRIETLIDIKLELKNKVLKFTIENTKEDEDSRFIENVGMKNVKRQLELIYGTNCKLEIEASRDLFVVNLLIHPDKNEGE